MLKTPAYKHHIPSFFLPTSFAINIDDVGISFGSRQKIFTDVLGMKHAAAKIVPKLLNFEQKQCRMDIAQKMMTTFNNHSDLLNKVITSDELWVYGCDI